MAANCRKVCMFLFPLGLKAKTRRFPFASVLIVAVTTTYSILHLEDADRAAVALANSPAAAVLVPARVRLTLAACARGRFSEEDCGFLKDNFAAETPQQPVRFASLTHDKLVARFQTKSDGKRAEMEAMLLGDEYWSERQTQFAELSEFQAYQKARDEFNRERAEWQARHHLLSAGNLSLRSLLEAMFTHAGWLHLVGNMVFFLFLAVAVEERVGPFAFVALYLLGGAVGDLTHVRFSRDEWQILLGASSNISAIAGMFLVLFWRLDMRVWVSAFFLSHRIVLIPTRIFIPVFVIANDLIGMAFGGSYVAHLAHLAGTGFGVLAGFVWLKIKPVREGSVFPFEGELLERARVSEEALVRLPPLAEVLHHHPENREALEMALVAILQEAETPWEMLEKPIRRFIKRNFQEIFADRLKGGHECDFVEFVAAIPKDWPLEKIVRSADFGRLKAVVVFCQDQRRFEVAARLLRLLCELTEGKLREQLEQYLASIEREIANAKVERTSA